jgi:hypothetical protein
VDTLKVGGETEAFCTSCKDMHEHIIVAMMGSRPAKVECGHCHKQHVYRAGPPGASKATKTSRAPAARARRDKPEPPPPPAIDLAARIAGREPVPYDPKARFSVGDVIRHPSFGVGVVVTMSGAQKMEAAFPSGSKLLSHDRAAMVPSTLVRPPRREDDDRRAVTDAPPDRPR